MDDWQFQKNDSQSVQSVEQVPGAFRRVLADGDRMMVIEWMMNPGVVVPIHNHPHEQSGYVVSGEMLFATGGVEHSITAGMGYAVAGTVPHGARFPVATTVIDIFSPPREDYRGTEASTYTLSEPEPEPMRARAVPARRTAAKRAPARKAAAKRKTATKAAKKKKRK